MELVVFIQGHVVKKLLGLLHRIEVSGGVEHQSSPMISRFILYLHHRHRPVYSCHRSEALYLVGEQLTQGADAIDNSSIGACLYGNTAPADIQGVSLILLVLCGHKYQIDITSPPSDSNILITRSTRKHLLQIIGSISQGWVVDPDVHPILQQKCPLALLHMGGQRDDAHTCLHTQRSKQQQDTK